MSESIEARLQRLIDIEDIKQLKARYASACDDDYNPDRLAPGSPLLSTTNPLGVSHSELSPWSFA